MSDDKIVIEDYKPNSYKYKQGATEKQLEPSEMKKVVSGPVKIKKRSGVQKLADVFIAEDVSKVKSHVLLEVLIPAAKKAISDIITDSINMFFYGESGRSNRVSNQTSKVSYSSISQGKTSYNSYRQSTPSNIYNIDEINFTSRGDAEMVLDQMEESISMYGFASVADLYDLAGISLGGNYTGNSYGWTNLVSAKIVPSQGGYLLKLPKASPRDR